MSKTKEKISISSKVSQLDEVVEWFYGDDFVLEEALGKYKAAQQLAQEIEKDLSELRNQVTVVEDFTKS